MPIIVVPKKERKFLQIKKNTGLKSVEFTAVIFYSLCCGFELGFHLGLTLRDQGFELGFACSNRLADVTIKGFGGNSDNSAS
jgi:hypothetical protein